MVNILRHLRVLFSTVLHTPTAVAAQRHRVVMFAVGMIAFIAAEMLCAQVPAQRTITPYTTPHSTTSDRITSQRFVPAVMRLSRSTLYAAQHRFTVQDHWQYSAAQSRSIADTNTHWRTITSTFFNLKRYTDWNAPGRFRLAIAVDSSLVHVPLGVECTHSGEMRLCIDGVLQHHYPGGIEEKRFVVPIIFTDTTVHWVDIELFDSAVETHRDAYHRTGFILIAGEFLPMHERVMATYHTQDLQRGAICGIIGIVSVMHVLIFLLYRRSRLHLYYALGLGGTFMVFGFSITSYADFGAQMLVTRISGIFTLWALLFFAQMVYFMNYEAQYYGEHQAETAPHPPYRTPRRFYLLAVSAIIIGIWDYQIPMLSWSNPIGGRTMLLLFSYCMIGDMVYGLVLLSRAHIRYYHDTRFHGIHHQHQRSQILAVSALMSGGALGLAGVGSNITMTLGWIPEFTVLGMTPNVAGVVAFIVAMSAYLAMTSASAHKRAVEQILEEQQIIALQKSELERLVNERTQALQIKNAEFIAAYEEADTLNKNLTSTLVELEHERAKADALVLNILPESIANRMKAGETTIADYYGNVTVLFADIVGFTNLSDRRKPQEIVELLNRIFSAFDIFSEQYKLEKIKTIGDSYMIVGGAPIAQEHHTEAVAAMALEMLETVKLLSFSLNIPLEIRIGIHTGEVIAGVIGKKKFSYDLWGDTVNLASRMESHGTAGKIHCSEAVYKRLQEKFTFEERGEITIKGKGAMKTYYLLERVSTTTARNIVVPEQHFSLRQKIGGTSVS